MTDEAVIRKIASDVVSRLSLHQPEDWLISVGLPIACSCGWQPTGKLTFADHLITLTEAEIRTGLRGTP